MAEILGREAGYFFDSRNGDRIYNAESMTDWLKPFFTTGIFNGDMQVTATTGMDISVDSGFVNVNGKVKHYMDTTDFTLDPASGATNRVDTVVVEANETDRRFYLKLVKGVDGEGATDPVREEGIYQLILAEIAVNAGVTEITQADITDKRMDSTVCGWVAATVEEIDMSQIDDQFQAFFEEFKTNQLADYTQWTAAQKALYLAWVAEQEEAYSDWIETNEADFLAWYDHIKDILDESTAGHLQNEIDALDDKIDAHTESLAYSENGVHGIHLNSDGELVAEDENGDEHEVGGGGAIFINSSGRIAIDYSKVKEVNDV